MVSIRKSIDIKAPIKDVFEWVQWAPNLVGVWPNLIKSLEFVQDETGLGKHKILYSMTGIEFEVTSYGTEIIPNEKIVAETREGIRSVIAFSFEAIPEGTRVDFDAEYTIPVSVLRNLIEGIVVRRIEKDIISLLDNMKHKLEILYGGKISL